MAWNKPSESPKQAPKKNLRAYGAIIAGLVIIAGLAIIWCCRSSQSPRDLSAAPAAARAAAMLPEATPDLTPKAAKIAPQSAKTKPKKLKYWEQPTTNGLTAAQIRKWKNVRVPPPSYTNNAMLLRPKSEFEIFGTRAENEIAMLLTIEPGEGLVGSPDYGEDFKQEFLKSCETPIFIDEENDTEYQKQLKLDMIQTKIELRSRMAAGEDLCTIMAESREEAMRLGRIKQEIEAEAHELFKDCANEEELDDAVSAMNALLEQKGIAPVKLSPMLRRSLIRRMRNY